MQAWWKQWGHPRFESNQIFGVRGKYDRLYACFDIDTIKIFITKLNPVLGKTCKSSFSIVWLARVSNRVADFSWRTLDSIRAWCRRLRYRYCYTLTIDGVISLYSSRLCDIKRWLVTLGFSRTAVLSSLPSLSQQSLAPPYLCFSGSSHVLVSSRSTASLVAMF